MEPTVFRNVGTYQTTLRYIPQECRPTELHLQSNDPLDNLGLIRP